MDQVGATVCSKVGVLHGHSGHSLCLGLMDSEVS